MTADSQETLSRALVYARRGWPVFPCQPGGKAPVTRHGFLDATTDPEQIRRWWEGQPAANVAIATGAPGPDVLDVDQRGSDGNGFAAFNDLKRAGLLDGAVAIIATPSGGLHAYFNGSDQPSGSVPRLHLDFKARGGYVVAPPSQVGGQTYRLLAERKPSTCGLDWTAVESLLAPDRHPTTSETRTLRGDAGHLAAWVARQRQGKRNAGLFWAACRAVESGLSDRLDDLAAAASRTGLDEREIARTIASARRAGQRAAGLLRGERPSSDPANHRRGICRVGRNVAACPPSPGASQRGAW
jgi:hypothetical protein